MRDVEEWKEIRPAVFAVSCEGSRRQQSRAEQSREQSEPRRARDEDGRRAEKRRRQNPKEDTEGGQRKENIC